MVLATLILSLIGAPGDAQAWRLYEPPGSDIRFSMPGTVRVDTKADETGYSGTIRRYRSVSGSMEYTVCIADLTEKYAPKALQLWEKDRFGKSVEAILTTTLSAANKAAKAKPGFEKFGNLKGFPIFAQLTKNEDGTGSNELAAFTKRGIIVAIAKGPRTTSATEDGVRFVSSLDFSKRQ